MGMKGTTVIELTDVNTGKVETYKDENMITNAISQLFSNNIEGMLYGIQGSNTVNWNDYHLPICPNAIGGILLFSDTLEEEVNNIYAPSVNPCVGYASNNVNSTANVMRGSLNLTESGKIERGYKYVWDFATSQGNGTISAVALTHKRGGVGYVGDSYDAGSRWLQMKNVSNGTSGATSNTYVDVVEMNFEANYLVAISVNKSNEVIIKKVRKCFRDIGLNFSLREGGDEVLETITITPQNFVSSLSSGNGYYDFIDGKNGYWYGFFSGGNSSGNASVKWIRIKKSDYSFKEILLKINETLFYFTEDQTTVPKGPEKEILIFLRSCDLHAVKRLDEIYLRNGFEDFFGGGYGQQGGVYIAEVIGDNARRAGFKAGEISTDTQKEIAYSVTVKDQGGKAMSGIKL